MNRSLLNQAIGIFKKILLLVPVGMLTAVMANAEYCNCDSGNGLVSPSDCGEDYSPDVQSMYEENRGQMISCCRPRAVQDYLIRCYNACGQPGRAVQKSKHVTGNACDATSSTVGERYGLSLVPHHGSLHWQD